MAEQYDPDCTTATDVVRAVKDRPIMRFCGIDIELFSVYDVDEESIEALVVGLTTRGEARRLINWRLLGPIHDVAGLISALPRDWSVGGQTTYCCPNSDAYNYKLHAAHPFLADQMKFGNTPETLLKYLTLDERGMTNTMVSQLLTSRGLKHVYTMKDADLCLDLINDVDTSGNGEIILSSVLYRCLYDARDAETLESTCYAKSQDDNNAEFVMRGRDFKRCAERLAIPVNDGKIDFDVANAVSAKLTEICGSDFRRNRRLATTYCFRNG
jgi:hypothetical protein